MIREPAREFLIRLVDEDAIESEPIAEIRADLAALGIDPAGPTALARRLAAGGSSPAHRLLECIEAAEDLDRELRALERADIAAVRQQLPSGTSAVALAQAQRAAGQATNVVALRRRRPRRLLYGFGAVAAALAASVVLYVGISQKQPGLSDSEQAPQFAYESDDVQARMRPAADAPASAPEGEVAEAAPAQPSTSGQAPLVVGGGLTEAPAPSPPGEEGAGPSRALQQTASSAAPAAETEQMLRDELRGDAMANRIAGPFGLDHPVAALLIVNPKLTPPGLKQEDYPTADLPARLGEAHRLASGRPIAALVRLQLADGVADAVILAHESGLIARLSAERAKTEPTAAAPRAEGYDLLLLERR